MNYAIDLEKGSFTDDEFEEIKLCLEMILSVRAGSQPLDRDLGIDVEQIVGYPLDVAQNVLSVEIIEKVEKYEPRVKIDSIEFDIGSDGQLIPRIYFVREEE